MQLSDENRSDFKNSKLYPPYSLHFYEYTESWSINLFADAGTSYFLTNEEDLGGFTVEELGMYRKQLLALCHLIPSSTDSSNFTAILNYFEDGIKVKTDTLLQNISLGKGVEEFSIQEINPKEIENLTHAFNSKDEIDFLNLFPSNFHSFLHFFGWNEDSNQPEKLYDQANDYIDYFFELINKKEHRKFEHKLIEIAKNGKWQADGIQYFQDRSMAFIKKNKRYELIDELEFEEAKSVLFFLLDGPHPQFDPKFTSELSNYKQHIVYDLFANEFAKWNEEKSHARNLDSYLSNAHYFTRNIDLNNDSLMDKVVSATPYQGDELLFFIKGKSGYQLALETSNFSEDGGNQIVDIKQEKGGIVLITAFPDRGFFEAHHHVAFVQDQWILTNTVYLTKSGNEENARMIRCDISQNINLADPELHQKFNPFPGDCNE